MDGEATSPGGMAVFRQRCDRYVNLRAAQEIDRSERFNFLKPVGQDGEHSWHVGNKLAWSNSLDQQFFSCGERVTTPMSLPMSLAGQRMVVFGCGYVGRALAQVALAAGAQVTALTRNQGAAAELRSLGIDVVVADLATAEWHRSIGGPVDFVVNCVSSGGRTAEAYRHSYVGGMRSILAWLRDRESPVKTFVYTSSTSVYPQSEGAVVNEETPAGEGQGNGRIIFESENLLRETPANVVRRSFVLRLAGIYGPGRHHLLTQLRAGARPMFGNAEQRMNLVHRDDIVAAIMACLRAPDSVGSSVFNVSDGSPVPKREIVCWLAAQLAMSVPEAAFAERGGRDGDNSGRDRIISSAKLQQQLAWRPQFPDYRAGYAAIFRAEGPRF